MTAPDRSPEAQEDLFAALREAKAAFPDMRTAQIILNALNIAPTWQVYRQEDTQLATAVRKWVDSMLRTKE